jgi:tRNA1(Val) A37 N6-methylase TrmN6
MAHLTEDTINDRVAEYLRNNGIEIYTQVKGVGKGANKPDFQIKEPKTIFGEGEWESSKFSGFAQMTDYSNLPGAEGSFLIIYPNSLKSKAMVMNVEAFFGDIKFHGLFNLKNLPSNPFFGTIKELPSWIDASIKGKQKLDKNAQIEIIRALVNGLAARLPNLTSESHLFKHVSQFLPDPGSALKNTNRAVAYLLVDQVVFYRILSAKLGLEAIDSSKINVPQDLYTLYFKNVIDNINYETVFAIDLSGLIPKRGLQYIRDLINVVNGMKPETFSSDFLGSMFHSVIPLDIRKPLAAYYTNQSAAALLSSLTIKESTDKVADFACGSGTLLVSAYDRKKKLLGRKLVERDHQKFIGEDISGIDVMVFAAHLAAVQLALKQPTYLSNKVRIGVEDSLLLYPGYEIKPLGKTLPIGQSKLTYFQDPSKLKERGSVGGDGTGISFKLAKANVIIMNPPFTRKQRISKEYRSELKNWLSSYKKWISDSYGLWAYFILLSDRFIEIDGKLGFVLPIAILRQSTYTKLRKFILQKFEVRYVMVGGYKCAFSENTLIRECLLVLEKVNKPQKTSKARFIFLKEKPTLTNTEKLHINITNTPNTEILDFCDVTQEELAQNDDWWEFIPEPRLSSSFKYSKNKVSSLLDFLGDEDALKQGLRFNSSSEFVSTKNSIISNPRPRISIEFEIIKETKNKIKFTDQLGSSFNISKKSLRPAIRTISYQDTIHVDSPPDWIVINRFENDVDFWQAKNINSILTKRKKHLDTRLGNIVMAGYGNFNFAAVGSSVIAVSSDELIAPTWTCWRLLCGDLDDAKILTLYLNSTFSIAKLIDISTEVGGSLRKWRKDKLLPMPVLDPKKLTESERVSLLKLYSEISNKKLPSILDQLENGNNIRNKIDYAIAEILIGPAVDKNKIRNLQVKIAETITLWKNMMGA